MRRFAYFSVIVLGCLFFMSVVSATDAFDNYFNYQNPADSGNSWFQKVLSDSRPNLGQTVNVKFKIKNGVSKVSGAKIKIYHSTQLSSENATASCVNWDMSKANLLSETTLPDLLSGQTLNKEVSFVVDQKYFKVDTNNNPTNNAIFELYSPSNSLSLPCKYQNILMSIDDNKNVDLAITEVTVSPTQPKAGTDFTVTVKVKNQGSEDFSSVNPVDVCLRRKELNESSSLNDTTISSSLCKSFSQLGAGQTTSFSYSLNSKNGFFPWSIYINDGLSVGTNRMSALIKDRENLAQNNYDNDERIFNLVITGESVVTPTNTNNQSNTNTSQTQIYTDGTLLKSPLHTSVYYYENGTRRPFPNAAVYYTWFANFNDLKMITVAQMENIKLGNPMPIKAGTKLLKFPYNPKVYEVTEGNKIKHIPNEATATAKFGKSWAKNVIELPEIYYLFYEDVS